MKMISQFKPDMQASAKQMILASSQPSEITVFYRLQKMVSTKKDGKKICLELLDELQEIEGVSGAHIMGPGQEQTVAEIIQAKGK